MSDRQPRRAPGGWPPRARRVGRKFYRMTQAEAARAMAAGLQQWVVSIYGKSASTGWRKRVRYRRSPANGRRTLPSEKVVRYLFEEAAITDRRLFERLLCENGARFYLDTGCHPEYATPECASPMDVMIYDKAGERILKTCSITPRIRCTRRVFRVSSRFLKITPTSVGSSYGCHENYLADRTR